MREMEAPFLLRLEQNAMQGEDFRGVAMQNYD
jgi:hypothetical protein